MSYENADCGCTGSSDAVAFENVKPVYETMQGWSDSTIGATQIQDLPHNAQLYIQRIAELVGCPVDIISTGPDRDQTIVLRHPFAE